ncbi:hypothetical protein HZS_1210 [Henneguya salminicola]|nr:hypothetical protein HZS_1210 [Henneguya salminicola]
MRNQCNNYQYLYSSNMPTHRLVLSVADKMHKPTMNYGQRPFGVGMLVASYDDSGTHLYQLCPSANYYDCIAMSIGARSQSAKTYLEKNLDLYSNSSLDQIIEHAIRALNDCLPNDIDLNSKNCGLAAVGVDFPFTIFDDAQVNEHVSLFLGNFS